MTPAPTKKLRTLSIVTVAVIACGVLLSAGRVPVATASEIATPQLQAAAAATTTTTAAVIESIVVKGTATANGQKLPPGTSITVFVVDDASNEVTCGKLTTELGGEFTLTLDTNCLDDPTIGFRLEGINATVPSPEAVTSEQSELAIDFAGLTPEQLTRLNITQTPATTETQQAQPLISETSLTFILLTVILTSGVVLMYLINTGRKETARNVQKPTEALVLLAVITGVIILGVTGKIGSDGLISVLAAIVGWSAARSVAAAPAAPPVLQPQPTPAAPAERTPQVDEAAPDGDEESGEED
jgi:hypothetical protein